MSTLYELSNELETLDQLMVELVDEETGEIIDSETLDKLEAEIELLIKNKAQGIVKYVAMLESNIVAIKNEVKRLNDLKKKAEKKVDNIKNYSLQVMQKMGKKKIETALGNLSIRKSNKLEIIDEDLVPVEFKKEVTNISINKAEIKKAMKTKEITGVRLVENYSLNIK